MADQEQHFRVWLVVLFDVSGNFSRVHHELFSDPKAAEFAATTPVKDQPLSAEVVTGLFRLADLQQPATHEITWVDQPIGLQFGGFAWGQTPWGGKLDRDPTGYVALEPSERGGVTINFEVPEPRPISYEEPTPTPAEDEPDKKLLALDFDTPALDLTSGAWVKSSEAATRDGVPIGVLKGLRSSPDAIRNTDGTLGQELYGRVWRREEKKQGKPTWYYLPSLLSEKRKKASSGS